MTPTMMCVALLVPAYGEKDIVKRIEDTGGGVSPDRARALLPDTTTDTDLDELCELRGLRYLYLRSPLITDRGFSTVAGLRGLIALGLRGTAITDTGLRHLESMSNLRLLNLEQCPNITDAGLSRLQKALPNCQILR
jgi:hypothetical protein